ncbi:metallopeptidase TldD-related protein [Myxococcota bacterium]|nr:metallopeptidase TldD-related protein [Myxococcota bacterium]
MTQTTRSSAFLRCSLLALGLFAFTSSAFAQPPVVSTSVLPKQTDAQKLARSLESLQRYQSILRDELQRYMSFFRAQKLPRAYYASFRLLRSQSVSLQASDGVILKQEDNRKSPKHQLQVSIRIGDHQRDNTGPDGRDWQIYRHLLQFPSSFSKELDEPTLRKRLWQLADREYKESLAQYHRKRYVQSLKVEIKDKSGDFSKEQRVLLTDAPPLLRFDMKKWNQIAKKVSLFSLKDPRIVKATISLGGQQGAVVMVDSDGSAIIQHKTLYMYVVQVSYLSAKKEYLSNTRLAYFDTEAGLPDEKQLTSITKSALQEIVDLSKAPEAEPIEAPAILLNDVAGVLFHEALGHRLEAQRMLSESDGRTFRSKIGKKIIPSFLSVLDDPTLRRWQDTPLNGHYLVDEQGVRSQPVPLIKEGVLQNFLLSRKPIDQFKRSNGHGRGVFGANPVSRQGNLLVRSHRAHPIQQLRTMLIEEARKQGKPYAFIIGKSSGGYTHTSTYDIQSFKNRPNLVLRIDAKTGEQTLVKGLEMIGTPLTVVNNIIATGDDYGVFNGFCGAESGYVPVSAIAPSLLLKTVEFQRVKIDQKKPRMLPSPFASK